MSARTRVLVGLLVLYALGVGAVLYRLSADLDPRYRESAEAALVDTANLLATLLERRVYSGIVPTDEFEGTIAELRARPLAARIFDIDKTQVDLRVIVADRRGTVLYDSAGRDTGADYSDWRDIRLTLAGQYGARTSADPDDARGSVMWVAAPIRERRAATDSAPPALDIVGAVSVGLPTATLSPFIAGARQRLVLVGAVSVLAFSAALVFVVVWLTRPFGLAVDVWRAVRREGGGARALARRLGAALRAAAAQARDSLSGRNPVEDVVQTLAHELKSPLAAIRGAAELLREPMPETARARFAGNIEEQVGRAQDTIDRLLELATLERQGVLDRVAPVALATLAGAVRDELQPVAARQGVTIALSVDPALVVSGDAVLLGRALANLVRNALDFAPAGSTVAVGAQPAGPMVQLTVRDTGPGVPAYAAGRVFERFYSLPRPETGRKGTGLGLAFVREVAALHGGAARLVNVAEGGALATLELPREPG